VADLTFNIALGKVAHYATLPETADALIAVPLETTGLAADTVMRDYETLAAILAGPSTEQTSMGRVTLTSVTATVNHTDNRAEVDSDPIVWPAPTGDPISAVIICYVPDTGTSTDDDIVPLTKHDVTLTPDGNEFTLTPESGIYRATSTA
jgi:hypothetical protein